MIEEHVENTGSARGKEILADFDAYLQKFKKIIPHDYKKMIALASKWEERGMSSEQAQMEAFNESFQMKERADAAWTAAFRSARTAACSQA